MTAKEELVWVLNGQNLLCAYITYLPDGLDASLQLMLPVGYTQEEYEAFLKELDFNYDNGYGFQHLYGTLWCDNGLWFDRHEYDGSECWQMHRYPNVPQELDLGNRLVINHPKPDYGWHEDYQLPEDTYDGGQIDEP